MSEAMAIGGLSRKSGVKVPTIRYYESVGRCLRRSAVRATGVFTGPRPWTACA